MLPAGAPLLRLGEPHDNAPAYGYGGLLQVVASGQNAHPAVNLLLRLDCHLPRARWAAFVAQLGALCQRVALDVLYYFDHELAEQVNLLLFFGNGRQGVVRPPPGVLGGGRTTFGW